MQVSEKALPLHCELIRELIQDSATHWLLVLVLLILWLEGIPA